MILTSDQTAKIKNAVKTKLVEIGAYVDDQLSDYVMIMITNKKTEKQMTEDLELFLGGLEQAKEFSSWLHELIKKTLDSSAEKSSSKHTSSHHHSHKKSTSTSKSSRNRLGSSSNGQSLTMNTSQNDSEELAIQIDSSEFNDDFGDDNEKKHFNKGDTKKRSSLTSKADSVSTVSTTSVKKPETHPEPVSKPQQTVNRFTKLVQETEKSDEQAQSKVTTISSTIGAVIQHEPPIEHETDFDKKRLSSIVKVSDRKYNVPKSMQPNKAILLKALDAANSSVKSSLGKTKSIADERLGEIRSRRTGDRYQREKTNQQEQTVDDQQRVKRLKKFEITFDQSENQELGVVDTRRILTDSVESEADSRLIIKNTEGGIFSDKRNVQIESTEQMSEDNMTEEKKLSISTDSEGSNNNISINLNKEPKFIVTLTGLEDNEFIKNLNNNKTPQKRMLSDMNDDFDNELDYDEEIMDDYMDDEAMAEDQSNGESIDVDEVNVEKQKKKLIRCTFWPMCDKGESCQFLHPNKPCTAFPNCTYGNLCHYLHPNCRYDGFCTRLDCTYVHVLKKPGPPDYNKPIDASLHEAKSEGAVVPGGAPKVTINKIQQSNVFIKNQMETTQTDTSVTSTVGDASTVVNKFSLNNNMTASNSFSQIRMPRAATNPAYFKAGPNPYQYGPNPYQYSFVNRAANLATSVNINCKYGKMCQNTKCIYVHPNLPQKSQMKWTAPLENTTNFSQYPNRNASVTNPGVQTDEVSKDQEPAIPVANSAMISQST